MQSSELLEYKIINLPESGDQNNIDVLVSNISNEPIVLQGNASLLFLLRLFFQIHTIATEVVYRADAQADGVLIYSTVDQEKYFRPGFVHELVHWTDAELSAVSKEVQTKVVDELLIDFTAVWEQVDEDNKSFLKIIYQYHPSQKKVKFVGEAPVVLALLAVYWFRKSEEIFYDTTKLH